MLPRTLRPQLPTGGPQVMPLAVGVNGQLGSGRGPGQPALSGHPSISRRHLHIQLATLQAAQAPGPRPCGTVCLRGFLAGDFQ